MHIPHLDTQPTEVGGQVLGHFLGEGGHQHALVLLRPGVYLRHQVVDLAQHRTDLHSGVQQAGRPDDLFHDLVRLLLFKVAGGGGDEHRLRKALLELLELQGAVIKGAGKAEAVVHQALLAGVVAVVHGAHLGQRHVALVHEEDKVLREEVQQRHGRAAHGPLGDDAGIVLDAGAVAQRPHHLHVVAGALVDALRLDELAVVLEPLFPFRQLTLDLLSGALQLVLGGDVVAGGIDRHVVQLLYRRAGDGVELGDALDLVAEELHAEGAILVIGGVQLHGVAPDAEHVALERHVVALVAILHQTAEQLVPLHGHARPERDHHAGEVVRLAEAVDTADGRHHVPPLQQGAGGTEAQAVDLLVGGGVLFDIGVRLGHVCLRLVVVVVGDEILHGVVGEELAELLAQLRRQRLVMRQHGAVHTLDDLRHGVGLAGAGDALEHLGAKPVFQALRQLFDGLGLVAGGLVGGDNFEIRHGVLLLFLQKSALRHGDVVVIRHHDVIRQTDVQRGESLLYLAGGQHVLLGGQRNAAGMVVRQKDGVGSGVEGVLHHLTHLHGRGRHAASADAAAGEQLALPVKADLIEKLLLLPRQQLHEVGSGAIRGVEYLLGQRRAAGAERHVAGEAEEQGSVFAHALHGGQLLWGGVEHVLEGAEMLQKAVRRLVGVLPGDGVKQQQLQELVVVHALGSQRQKAAFHPLAVPIVQTHASPLPRGGKTAIYRLYSIPQSAAGHKVFFRVSHGGAAG